LASVKGNITALSVAIDVGNIYIIKELIQIGADTNSLTEASQARLQELIAAEAARTPQLIAEPVAEPATEFVHVNSLTDQPQVDEPIKPKKERRQKAVELQNLSIQQTPMPQTTMLPTPKQVMAKLSLPFELPGQTGYPINAIPAFWKRTKYEIYGLFAK
jgi:hypothetical protein